MIMLYGNRNTLLMKDGCISSVRNILRLKLEQSELAWMNSDRKSFQTAGVELRIIQMEKPFQYLLILKG